MPDFPVIATISRYNENGRRGAGNTADGLTHSSDLSREGLGMKPTHKTCNACGETKPLSDFYKNKRNITDGRQAKCRECQKVCARQWDIANAKRRRDRQREWETEHPDYYGKKYRRSPHWKWESNYRRRMTDMGRTPVVTSFTKEQLLDAYGDACVYCGGPFEQIDHVIPLVEDGEHSLENVRPSCRACNQAKGSKIIGARR